MKKLILIFIMLLISVSCVPKNYDDFDPVQFISLYYDNINNAQTVEDLLSNWNHLSLKMREAGDYDPVNYGTEWLQYRVKYVIWQCDSTTADILLRFYGKSDVKYEREYTYRWVRFKLDVDSDGKVWIMSGSLINDYGTNCILKRTS